jgi:hypothetical protein
MLCPNCKANIDEDALFCPHCASSLAETKSASQITVVRRPGSSKAVVLTVASAALLLTAAVCVGLIVFYYGSDWFGPKAQIVGDVSDGFGAPLSNVAVSIEGTAFTASTSGRGHYGIQYVPGKIKLSFNKDGYLPVVLDLEIATESKFPAHLITLIKIPPSQGIFFFGGSEYVPVTKGKIAEEKKEFAFSWDNPLVDYSYLAEGGSLPVERRPVLKFIDNVPVPMILLRIKEGRLIFKQTRYWGKTEDKFDLVKANVIQLRDRLTICEVSLEIGKYAFVAMKSDKIGSGGPSYMTGPPIGEPVYLFEVK